jgi:Sulfotransferase family
MKLSLGLRQRSKPTMDFEFCFVFGCQRSGTTALAGLLHSHDAVVIGMERYKNLIKRRPKAFRPALFEPDRFFDFQEGDTNLNPSRFGGHRLHHLRVHYDEAYRRFADGTVRYVGDKVRAHESVLSPIAAQFPSPKFVFIYRDLLRVAGSFNARAGNPRDRNWPATNDHEFAVKRWYESFATADALIERIGLENVFIVKHERLFNGEMRTCHALFRFLGLDTSSSVRRNFRARTATWEERQTKPPDLTADQRDLVLQHLDHGVLDRFDSRFEEQFARYGGG